MVLECTCFWHQSDQVYLFLAKTQNKPPWWRVGILSEIIKNTWLFFSKYTPLPGSQTRSGGVSIFFVFLYPRVHTCSSCATCIKSHFKIPFVLFIHFFSGFLGWRVCCGLVRGTLAFGFVYPDSFAIILVFCLSLWQHNLCLSRMNQDGTLGVLISLSRKNGLM